MSDHDSHVEVKGIILGDHMKLSPVLESCQTELESYSYTFIGYVFFGNFLKHPRLICSNVK